MLFLCFHLITERAIKNGSYFLDPINVHDDIYSGQSHSECPKALYLLVETRGFEPLTS